VTSAIVVALPWRALDDHAMSGWVVVAVVVVVLVVAIVLLDFGGKRQGGLVGDAYDGE
jgi:hypothetical protein